MTMRLLSVGTRQLTHLQKIALLVMIPGLSYLAVSSMWAYRAVHQLKQTANMEKIYDKVVSAQMIAEGLREERSAAFQVVMDPKRQSSSDDFAARHQSVATQLTGAGKQDLARNHASLRDNMSQETEPAVLFAAYNEVIAEIKRGGAFRPEDVTASVLSMIQDVQVLDEAIDATFQLRDLVQVTLEKDEATGIDEANMIFDFFAALK